MEHFIKNYKGYKIIFEEINDRFVAIKEDEKVISTSCLQLEKKIDKIVNGIIKKNNLKLFIKNYNYRFQFSEYEVAKITSINMESEKVFYSIETKNGIQKKQDYIQHVKFYKINEDNKALIEKRAKLIEQIQYLKEEIFKIEHDMAQVDICEIGSGNDVK